MRSVAIVFLLMWLLTMSGVIAMYGSSTGEPRLVAIGIAQCVVVLLLTWSIVEPVRWYNLWQRMRNISLSFTFK